MDTIERSPEAVKEFEKKLTRLMEQWIGYHFMFNDTMCPIDRIYYLFQQDWWWKELLEKRKHYYECTVEEMFNKAFETVMDVWFGPIVLPVVEERKEDPHWSEYIAETPICVEDTRDFLDDLFEDREDGEEDDFLATPDAPITWGPLEESFWDLSGHR